MDECLYKRWAYDRRDGLEDPYCGRDCLDFCEECGEPICTECGMGVIDTRHIVNNVTVSGDCRCKFCGFWL